MTAAHIAVLHFQNKMEATKKRLQKLKAAGVIGDHVRHVNEPRILFLTDKALVLLRTRGMLAQYPKFGSKAIGKRSIVSELTIRHELDIQDVKVAFHAAVRKNPNLRIVEFSTWPFLYEFRASLPEGDQKDVLVRPDAFIRIQMVAKEGGVSEHKFFLEVDRSTETQGILVTRVRRYVSYYKSGKFALRNDGARSDYSNYPFRVLLVFKSSDRKNNTAIELLGANPPIFTQAYLTTFQDVITDPLGSIWIRPVDLSNVSFLKASLKPRRRNEYVRDVSRNCLIEEQVRKSSILRNYEHP